MSNSEFDHYAKSLLIVTGERCRRDLNTTLWGIRNGHEWATAIYDASVKSAIGLQSGVVHQFGHYDQCLNREIFNDQPVQPQYCLLEVPVSGIVVQTSSRKKEAAYYTENVTSYWALCMPISCSAEDIAKYASMSLQRDVGDKTQPKCQSLDTGRLNLTKGMLIYAGIICFFILLALISTICHICLLMRNDQGKTAKELNQEAKQQDLLTMIVTGFSIIENSRKLVQVTEDEMGLKCINGIKALAMLLIIAGHAVSFILGGPMYNVSFINDQLRLPVFSFLTNSLLFADMFLLLSGFLLCRILLFELERRGGKVNPLMLYVARYIRLTPAYIAIIGFYMTWFPHIGSGPIWNERIGLEKERCQDSWWLNILYINNYFGTDKLCMFQSWYLSVDSQLFFVAPFVVYVLYKWKHLGLRLLCFLVVLTAVIPFLSTYVEHLDPTLMIYPSELSDLARNSFYINSYIKTHMRASAYIIGLLAGYLVHVIQKKHIRLSHRLVQTIWLCAVFIGTGSMYSVTRFYIAPYTNFESSLYAGFHKLGWNLSVGWLVIAITTGHANWLQKTLSSRVFAPISRLTYCAYLSNGIVELYHSASIRYPTYMGFVSLTNIVFSHSLNTFLIAIVISLLFESPIHALERILRRKFDNKTVRCNPGGTTKTTNEMESGEQNP
ncbi:nose resistant to fluoxetine protein 6 [Drosophila willistoni]|uniref:nose resistant to fluoxetine protein 6 n=1 Tax=Drosophila willistoni TaxID=7260 RepID=UPI000C26C1D6|nr:nose resistant to fluoxetine protein 6 [Drosophila willistoni]